MCKPHRGNILRAYGGTRCSLSSPGSKPEVFPFTLIRAANKISTLAHSFLPIALAPLRCKGMHVKNHTENTQSPKSA